MSRRLWFSAWLFPLTLPSPARGEGENSLILEYGRQRGVLFLINNLQDLFHVLWIRRRELHPLSRYRVSELEAFRVKHLSPQALEAFYYGLRRVQGHGLSSVNRVSDYGVLYGREMHPYLVGPSCFRAYFKE